MKKWSLLFTLVVLPLVLAGCISQPVPAKKETQRLMIVSSGKPSAVLPSFKTYSWSNDYNQVLSKVGSKNKGAYKGYVRQQIQTYLSTKGYEFRADPQQADVVFGFLFALEDAIGDKIIEQRFGLLPGVKRNLDTEPRYKKGSFILAVLDPQEKTIYWRSAVKGFVDIEKDRVEGSSQQMQGILGLMLGDFPPAGH